jgi:hypothetical protein
VNFFEKFLEVLPTNIFFSVLVFTVLLVIKLQNDLSISWFLVYTPLWFIVGITLLLHLSTFTQGSVDVWNTLVPGMVTIPFVGFLVMVYFYISATITKPPTFVVFIPLFWVEILGLGFLCIIPFLFRGVPR